MSSADYQPQLQSPKASRNVVRTPSPPEVSRTFGLQTTGLMKTGLSKWPSGCFVYTRVQGWPRRKKYESNAPNKFFRFLKSLLQVLWKRIAIWGKLNHPNVIAFRGVNTEHFGQLALVYDWAEHRDILQYIELNPAAPRQVLVLIRLPNSIVDDLTLIFTEGVASRNRIAIPPRPWPGPWQSKRGKSPHGANRTDRQPATLIQNSFALCLRLMSLSMGRAKLD